jgi:hypothetical protein
VRIGFGRADRREQIQPPVRRGRLFFLDDPSKARADADRVFMLYSEERDGHLLAILSHDPKTGALLINAL